MSDDLELLLSVLRGSKKLKRSRAEWDRLLADLRSADLGLVLDRLAPPVAVKKVSEKKPDDPLVADLKEIFKPIKGSIGVKITSLEQTRPFLDVVDASKKRAGWAAAVKHWRMNLGDDAIRAAAQAFVANKVKQGVRTITLETV